MRTSSLLSLAIAAAAVAASPALHAQTPTPNGRSTLVLVAPADSNRILRAVLTRASRLVESRSGGAVRVDVQYRGVTEESMVLSPGQNGAGVVLVGSGLPRVCAGAAALRVPRDLSASDFDRGFAGVRAEVEATCRSALSPVAWFSAGPRYFVSQATTRGAAASPVASPDMLREYYSPTATLDEANLYGFHVGDLTPRLFLSPGVEVDAAAAAMPPSTVGPSGVLMVPMGAHVGVVAFASSALAALAPAQRTMVSTIFRDAERALTTDLRRASEASIASLANRNLTVIRPAGDDLGAWTRLTTAVESRYLRSATTGTILQHFLAAAGQPLPSTPTPTPTTPTVTTAPAETTTPTPSPAMAPAAVVDATPDSGTIAPTTAAATSMAGRYSAVAPTWTGNLMLDADGTFTRDNGTSGRWTYDASTLSLAWGTRPAENLFLSQPGRFESRMHLALTQLGPRTVPSFEFSLTDLNDGPTRDAYRQLLQASVTPSLRTCYTRTLGRSPGTQGRVMVRVVIEPTGVVRTGEVSVNTVNDSALTTCVVTAARRFPVTPAPVAPVEFELGVTFFAQ